MAMPNPMARFRLIKDVEDVQQEMREAGILPATPPVNHIPGSSRRRGDALAASAARIDVSAPSSAAVTASVARYARQWQKIAWDYYECVDTETEILTIDGWRRHDEIQIGDLVRTLDHETGTAGWEPVLEVIGYDVQDRDMLSMEMRHHSSLTTMGHRWPVLGQVYTGTRRTGLDRRWVTSATMPAEAALITAAPSRDLPTEPKYSDEFVALVGWFWTEGAIRPDRRRPSITISQSLIKNPEYAAEIEMLLEHVFPGEWRQWDRPDGQRYFTIRTDASERLLTVAPNRVAALDFIRSLTLAQLHLFCDVSIRADGYFKNPSGQWISQSDSVRLAAYEYACILRGTTPHTNEQPQHGRTVLTELPRSTAHPRKKSRSITQYTGRVWCVQTPSQSWLARRHGTVFFTGNCIGEIRYGFGALASAGSRATLMAGIYEDPTKPPITLTAIKDTDPYYQQVGPQTRNALLRANDFLSELTHQLLRNAIINISVAGEFYLTYMDDEWTILSSEELVPMGANGEIITETRMQDKRVTPQNWMVRRDRGRSPEPLDPDAYLARIWNAHPRWQQEPTSSMLGILDQCEALLLLDQMVRSSTRSRLFAGALFVPDTVTGPNETESIEADITQAALTAITQEDAAFGVVPLVLSGPPEAGEQIKLIALSRGIDEDTVLLIERTLDRILTGIDLPKEFVKGLGSAKYANAVILEEGMYRLHIAPLLEMICEALTKVYLRPRLLKDGVSALIADRIVTTFDPSNIVTRPDRAQAANDGYDRKVLSGASWRAARGFPESDAPTDEERFKRLMVEKGVIPPDTAAASLEYLGGQGLATARHYVESINAAETTPSGSPMATPREEAAETQAVAAATGGGPGTGSNQETGPEVQTPTAPGEPVALPPELTEILPPEAEQKKPTRPRNVVPGSNRRPGEMLPPAPR